MRSKPRRASLILAISAITFLSLVLLWILPSGDKRVTSGELYHWVDSLPSPGERGDEEFIKEQAYKLAANLSPQAREREQLANELANTYLKAEGKDFLLVYNTGGFGGTGLVADPEWSTVLAGIQAELTRLGYTSTVVEHGRGEYGLAGCIREVEDLSHSYASKAPELAAKIAFLTKYDPDIKVIITGRSLGAIFSHEVMKFFSPDCQVYSIQAGYPFWYTEYTPTRTLVVNDNGVVPDAISSGDFGAIIRANLWRLPSSTKPEGGSMKIGPYFFIAPGHEYTWECPGVSSEIITFLAENFGEEVLDGVYLGKGFGM